MINDKIELNGWKGERVSLVAEEERCQRGSTGCTYSYHLCPSFRTYSAYDVNSSPRNFCSPYQSWFDPKLPELSILSALISTHTWLLSWFTANKILKWNLPDFSPLFLIAPASSLHKSNAIHHSYYLSFFLRLWPQTDIPKIAILCHRVMWQEDRKQSLSWSQK